MRLVAVAFVITALALPTLAAAATPSSAKHDRDVIRFFLHHPRLAAKPAGQRALWRILHRLTEQIRTLQAVRDTQPAHLRLWRCIEVGESGGDGVHHGSERASNGSHFNVLQMTDPWGRDFHPIGKSYQEVEAEAEKQYAASGYSRSWLDGQWHQTIGPCWGYAE